MEEEAAEGADEDEPGDTDPPKKEPHTMTWGKTLTYINGHFRNLNWRHLPYVRLV